MRTAESKWILCYGKPAHGSFLLSLEFRRLPPLLFACRRPNGYFIYSTVQGVSFQPQDVPIGPLDLNLVSASNTVLLMQTGWMQVLEGHSCLTLLEANLKSRAVGHCMSLCNGSFMLTGISFQPQNVPEESLDAGLSGRAWNASQPLLLGKAPHAGQRSRCGRCAGHPLPGSIHSFLCWLQ